MKTFDWIFTWIVPLFLFACLIYGLLTAKRKYRPLCSKKTLSDGSTHRAWRHRGYVWDNPRKDNKFREWLCSWAVKIKKMFDLSRLITVAEEPKTKPFGVKLCEAIGRAEEARKSILHSGLPEKDRLKIASEILYMIDDLNELSKIREMEIDRLCQHLCFANKYPFGSF